MAEHEIDLCLGTGLAEIIAVLGELPSDVVLSDHYGDVDLSLIFRQPPPAAGPATESR